MYTPNSKQKRFHASTARYRLYGGARGGGKSHAIRMEAVRQMLTLRGLNGLILRRTYAELEASIIQPLLRILPRGSYTYSAARHTLTLGGGVLTFGYCQTAADVVRYQGAEYDFIGFDELTHFREEWYDTILASLRTTRPWTPNVFASANPGGIGHSWVKRRWIERQFKSRENPADYAFFPARATDNPALADDKAYLQYLESLPTPLRRAWRDGDWDIFVGQFFTEWSRQAHVIPPLVPEPSWRKFACLDYGYAAPSCVLWCAVTPTGQLVVYRELYERELTYRALGTRVRELTPPTEQLDYIVVDPALAARSPGGGESGLEALTASGLPIRRGDNTRVAGWIRLREYLKINPKTKRPQLLVTESCPHLIRTLPALVHDAVRAEDCDTTGDDHAPDALRYGVMSRPTPHTPVPSTPAADTASYPGALESFVRTERQRLGRRQTADFWNG